MNDEKKELKVAALENGTVIDHIPSSQLFKVVSILGLENCTNSITIGNNLASKKIGKKGIIKVADRFFKEEDLNSPGCTNQYYPRLPSHRKTESIFTGHRAWHYPLREPQMHHE